MALDVLGHHKNNWRKPWVFLPWCFDTFYWTPCSGPLFYLPGSTCVHQIQHDSSTTSSSSYYYDFGRIISRNATQGNKFWNASLFILFCVTSSIFSSSTQQQAVASFMASTLKRDSSQFINSLLVYKITSHTFSPTFNADENMWKIVPTPTHTYKSIYINVGLNSIHL